MENSNGEPHSFFEAPAATPEVRNHYDRFTPRDEKIAEINAHLATKTRIIPEQVQQRLIMENNLTKHWVPLSDKDSRRFGPPTPETERKFEKAVAAEVLREKELLKRQGFSEDQIASKITQREEQARVRLARDKKEFFTIRDKPFEAPKAKTNGELLSDARVAYDEAEKQFKTKLNSLLDDANEKTNGQARAAKIQLEKARKNLIHAFTGEDDPELVKKYTELLQRSPTRAEAEEKIFRYKQETQRRDERDPRSFFTPDEPIERPKRPEPRVFTPQEEASMRSLFEETDDDDVFVGPDGMGTPVHKSPFARETNSRFPKPEVGTNDPVLDALDESGSKLRLLTEEMPVSKESNILTDQTVDNFIEEHMINSSALVAAYELYLKEPSAENKEKLLTQVNEVGSQFTQLPDFTGIVFKGAEEPDLLSVPKEGEQFVLTQDEILYRDGLKKFKAFKNYNANIRILLNYSLEATGEIQSQLARELEAQDEAIFRKLQNTKNEAGEHLTDTEKEEYLANMNEQRKGYASNIVEFRRKVIQDLADDLKRAHGQFVPSRQEPFNSEAFSKEYPSAEVKKREVKYEPKEITDIQEITLNGDTLDAFIDDHFIDVSTLTSAYQRYRENQKNLSELRKRAQNGDGVPVQDIQELEKTVSDSRETLKTLVNQVDDEWENGKGLDANVNIRIVNDSAASGNRGKDRQATRLYSFFLYQSQVKDLLELAEEATGKKRSKKGREISRSDTDVEEFFKDFNQNVARIKGSPLATDPKVSTERDALNIESEVSSESDTSNIEPEIALPLPENAVDLPPKIVELKATVKQIEAKLQAAANNSYFDNRPEDDLVLNELAVLIDRLKSISDSPVQTDNFIQSVSHYIDKVDIKRKDVSSDRGQDWDYFSTAEVSLRTEKRRLLQQIYDEEIDLAVEQSTPEAKKVVPITGEEFRIVVEDEITSLANGLWRRIKLPVLSDDVDKDNLRRKREYIKKVMDNIFIIDDLPDSNNQSYQETHSYVNAVKGLLKLIDEVQQTVDTLSNTELGKNYSAELLEQTDRVVLFS
mgnify:CR=1 FL=1